MIRSYGLHWRNDNVIWGRGGRLYGAASRSRRATEVDFTHQRGIYALYSGYEIVYVGQTGAGDNDRLFHRLKHHNVDHLAERWDRFSWFGTHWVTRTGELSFDAATISQDLRAALNVLKQSPLRYLSLD